MPSCELARCICWRQETPGRLSTDGAQCPKRYLSLVPKQKQSLTPREKSLKATWLWPWVVARLLGHTVQQCVKLRTLPLVIMKLFSVGESWQLLKRILWCPSVLTRTQMRIIQLLLCVNRPSVLTLRFLSVVMTRPLTTSRWKPEMGGGQFLYWSEMSAPSRSQVPFPNQIISLSSEQTPCGDQQSALTPDITFYGDLMRAANWQQALYEHQMIDPPRWHKPLWPYDILQGWQHLIKIQGGEHSLSENQISTHKSDQNLSMDNQMTSPVGGVISTPGCHVDLI